MVCYLDLIGLYSFFYVDFIGFYGMLPGFKKIL